MRYAVRCSNSACYLKDGAMLADLIAAEHLAFAHEKRMEDRDEAHVVTVRDTIVPTGGNAGDVSSGGSHA